MENTSYQDLPAKVLAAFADRTMLSTRELARVLEIDRGTLSKLVANGDISGRLRGTGSTRHHWGFTIGDVAQYLRGTNWIATRREEGLDVLRAALAQRPLKFGTVNVTIRRRRRKAKPVLGGPDQNT